VLKDSENLFGEKLKDEYKNVFVTVKVLIKEKEKAEVFDEKFYENVVTYTNRQNAISEKQFSSNKVYFEKIKNEFLSRGFLLETKPSDKNSYKEKYKNKINDEENLIRKASNFSNYFGLEVKNYKDLIIPLDKLLQVCRAYHVDGYEAYTKKNEFLKGESKIYTCFSLRIIEIFTIERMLRLFLLFKKAEKDRKNSEDQRTPSPYYLLGFLSTFSKSKDKIDLLDRVLSLEQYEFNHIYNFCKKVTQKYVKNFEKEKNVDYNKMIKSKIDQLVLTKAIEDAKEYFEDDKKDEYRIVKDILFDSSVLEPVLNPTLNPF
jgi:AIPR protein